MKRYSKVQMFYDLTRTYEQLFADGARETAAEIYAAKIELYGKMTGAERDKALRLVQQVRAVSKATERKQFLRDTVK